MKILKIGFLFAFILGFATTSSVYSQDIQLTVIGNSESVPDELDMDQLVSVLKGEKLRWDDGTAIKIALMKTNTPIGTGTCKKIYNMSGNELNKYFLALVFQGKVKAPTFFNSVRELEEYVADTPGAIGVTQDSTNDQLKVILINGKKQI